MQPKPTSPRLKSSKSIEDATRIDRERLDQSEQKLDSNNLDEKLASSKASHAERSAANPRLEYSEDLPITAYREELRDLIRSHQAIVVCGETGSGKSTQLPKICLEAGLGRKAMIGHTQPRRLAARSIASRLAEELDTTLGQWVGYKVRFADQTGDQTLIKLMTDGILLAETQSDRSLSAYDAIIIDEAHERSLNIDFLLGYLKQLMRKRDDLKIIITSATIDAERFADHFATEAGPAPIVSVEGRGYPVEIKYLPWEDAAQEESRRYDLSQHVLAGIEATRYQGSGDVLVFLPTERDIREVSHRVAGHYKRLGLTGKVDLLPLYARLPQAEQQRIFRPEGGRQRIIFATNVAESSLTVPGIRFVVDSGTARISRYSTRSKLQRLPIEPISRASADQRAGRCGRVGPGTCVRLYSLDDYEQREAYTTPEIRRTNLAAVVLRTKTLRLGELASFPLLDPPKPDAIRDGIRTLLELGALDERHTLTETGWTLGRLPIDPRVGRILLAADEFGCLPEILPIAAALEIQDPRDRPPDKRDAADEAHSIFTDSDSDFLALLRLWRFYQDMRSQLSRNRLEKALRQRFLSPARMREWSDVYRQLRELAATLMGNKQGRSQARRRIGSIRYLENDTKIVSEELYEKIHLALLSGLLSGVAHLGNQKEYSGAGGLKLFLWPGSGVFSGKPKWVVAAELVETSKQFARTVAKIQPGWVESIGAHLMKRSHVDPHWSKKSGGAFCYENQTLFGLPIVSRRRVPLTPIDPATARDLLIDHGLAEQELRTVARFVRHNRSVLDSIAELANRTRNRELVIDGYQIARFYQNRLPAEICDRGRLEKLDRTITPPSWADSDWDALKLSQWLKDPPTNENADSLYLRPEDLLEAPDPISTEDFPEALTIGHSKLPLEYSFQPGSDRDGINVKVHETALSQLSEDRLGWLVPGLLVPKLIDMIKSLPKRIRRNLVPAAEVAEKIADELAPVYGTIPFMSAVCQAMSQHAEMPVMESDFQTEKMRDHLNFLVTVVDDSGATLGEGRELIPLQRQFAKRDASAGEQALDGSGEDSEAWSRSCMKTFDIENLPREVIRLRGGVQVAQYPGLVNHAEGIRTQLFPDLASAETAIRTAVTRLYAIGEHKELRTQVRHLPQLEQTKIKLSGVVSASDLESKLIELIARIAFVEKAPVIRSRDVFEARRQDRGRRISIATQDVALWLVKLADERFAIQRHLESGRWSTRHDDLIGDVNHQLRWLFYNDFLNKTPWEWLQHYPRYLQAIVYRLDRVGTSKSRDVESMELIGQLWRQWMDQTPQHQQSPAEQTETMFRWMIEELRVSLFAQPLGTSVKVSPQRCANLLK